MAMDAEPETVPGRAIINVEILKEKMEHIVETSPRHAGLHSLCSNLINVLVLHR